MNSATLALVEQARLHLLTRYLRDLDEVLPTDGTDLLERYFEATGRDWRDEALWDAWIDYADEAMDLAERSRTC